MGYRLDSAKVSEATRTCLSERGVSITDIAELVHVLQSPYFEELSIDECEYHVDKVLQKREVQNAILTGIQLDILSEEGKLMAPLQDMIAHDESLYGCIGLTNFGYIDKLKPGVLQRLNDKSDGPIHTFLDDIIGAVAAAASSRIAHSKLE